VAEPKRLSLEEKQEKEREAMRGGPHEPTLPEFRYLGRFATGRYRRYRKDGVHLDRRGTFVD